MREEPQRIVRDVWEIGEGYESFIGRWSRLVAPVFLRWLSVPSKSSWLDVGCGTGILSRAILEGASPLHVKGVDPSPGFVASATTRIRDPRATFEVGSAEDLKCEPGTYDAVVSGLVLNFIPDWQQAVSEMKRVTKPGGAVGAYVWDYAGGMQMLRHFWDAASALDLRAAELDEGQRFSICKPERLKELFVANGLSGVNTRPIDVQTHFIDFEDFWSPFLSGQGPAPSYVASLTGEEREALRELVRSLLPISADGSIDLTARAWAVQGRIEKSGGS